MQLFQAGLQESFTGLVTDPDELDDLGLRDLRGAGSVLLVEWPEKAEGRLNTADLALTLDYAGPEARTLVAVAHSPAGQAVLGRL